MKRTVYMTICVVLGLVIVGCLTACGNNHKKQSSPKPPIYELPEEFPSPKPVIMDGHVEDIDMHEIDYSGVENEELRLLREKQSMADNELWSIFGFAINHSTTCEMCGMHPDLLRNDMVPVENAAQIKESMSLSQVYELIGNPHWGQDASELGAIIGGASSSSLINKVWNPFDYYYVLSDGRALIISYINKNGKDIVQEFRYLQAENIFNYVKSDQITK